MICLYTIQQHRNDGHRNSLGQEVISLSIRMILEQEGSYRLFQTSIGIQTSYNIIISKACIKLRLLKEACLLFLWHIKE